MTYYARVTYPNVDGATTNFVVPFPYLQAAHVEVYVLDAGTDPDGATPKTLAVDYTFGSSSVIVFGLAPAAGKEVLLKRVTPRGALLNPLTAPAAVLAGQLNTDNTQLLYIGQEALDQAAYNKTRSLLVPEGEASQTLPPITARANKALGFSNAGAPVALTLGPDNDPSLRLELASAAVGEGAGLVAFGADTGDTTLTAALKMAYPGSKGLLAEVLDRWHRGTPPVINWVGDSEVYGQDTSGAGVANTLTGPINGSGALSTTRSRTPSPESLAAALALNQFTTTATVNNCGYPGDTTAMGRARWVTSGELATPGDVLILDYGVNDGKNTPPLATIGSYKLEMRKLIEWGILGGAAVILCTPFPISEPATQANIAAYRTVCRELAEEYNLILFDKEEQLSPITTKWSAGDLVHGSSFSFGELGWSMAAIFNTRDLGAKSLTAGSIWYPQDWPGYGGVLLPDTRARGGQFAQIEPNQRYFIGGYFPEDVLPIIHSFNTNATSTRVKFQYSGDGAYSGLEPAELVHVAAAGSRQSLAGPVMRRGWRNLMVLIEGTQTAYLNFLECAPVGTPQIAHGLGRKSAALSGVGPSPTVLAGLGAAAKPFWWAVDPSLPLSTPAVAPASPVPLRVAVDCYIKDLAGPALFKNREGTLVANPLLNDFLWVFRNGTSLTLRQVAAGVVTDTTTAAVFSAGVDFDGWIELVVTSGNALVNVNGVNKIAFASPAIVKGFPGLMAFQATTGFRSRAVEVDGHGKGPYFP